MLARSFALETSSARDASSALLFEESLQILVTSIGPSYSLVLRLLFCSLSHLEPRAGLFSASKRPWHSMIDDDLELVPPKSFISPRCLVWINVKKFINVRASKLILLSAIR